MLVKFLISEIKQDLVANMSSYYLKFNLNMFLFVLKLVIFGLASYKNIVCIDYIDIVSYINFDTLFKFAWYLSFLRPALRTTDAMNHMNLVKPCYKKVDALV